MVRIDCAAVSYYKFTVLDNPLRLGVHETWILLSLAYLFMFTTFSAAFWFHMWFAAFKFFRLIILCVCFFVLIFVALNLSLHNGRDVTILLKVLRGF